MGKTALSLEVAQEFETAIVSADSRQCFRELNIGVAKPTLGELRLVPHFFIDSHSIQDTVNAATFESYALQAVGQIFAKHPVGVMVGGTGLYIKAFCHGLDEMPAVPDSIRAAVRTGFERDGLAWLQQQLLEKDPVYLEAGERQNPQRLMRALEMVEATGKSIRSFQTRPVVERPFRIVKIGLDLPRELLYDRINRRVDEMMIEGLLEEVRQLLPFRHLNALQTVGYSEFFDYLDGKCTLAEAVELVKQNTRRYAKRQLTWFRKDEELRWFSPTDKKQILAYIESELQRPG